MPFVDRTYIVLWRSGRGHCSEYRKVGKVRMSKMEADG